MAVAGSAQPLKAHVAVITHVGGAHMGLYFRALAMCDEVTSVVLIDPDGAFDAEAQNTLGAKLRGTSKNLSDAFASHPAVALVSMEARMAPPAIEAALQAGCHVIAEKPACVAADDFARLAALANQSHRLLMLALCNRVLPEVVEARKLVQSGELGAVYGLEMHLVQDQSRLKNPAYQTSWMADKARAGGGHLAWLGIHWLDLAMFITGAPITHVAGFAGNVGGQPLNIEDSVAMSMKFANDRFGTLTSGYYLDKGHESYIKIWGEHGRLELNSDAPGRVRRYDARNAKTEMIESGSDADPYSVFVREAVRASVGMQAPPIITDDSLRVLKAVHATYRAAETGITQRVE